jgi:hypothetical protein
MKAAAGGVFAVYPAINNSMSESTVSIPAIPNFSTKTFATFGDRKPGRVGPRWMFLTPILSFSPFQILSIEFNQWMQE